MAEGGRTATNATNTEPESWSAVPPLSVSCPQESHFEVDVGSYSYITMTPDWMTHYGASPTGAALSCAGSTGQDF